MLICWCAQVLVASMCFCVGVLVFCVLVRSCVEYVGVLNVAVSRCFDVLMCWCVDIFVCLCVHRLVFWCLGVLVP